MIVSSHEQNTPEWIVDRVGSPTASNASSLITSKAAASTSMHGYAEKLARELFTGRQEAASFEGSKATKRGHEYEPSARKWLAFDHGLKIPQVGFCKVDDGKYGCSPDGLIDPIIIEGKIKGCKGLVEFKCQEDKGHHETLMYWKKHGKAPSTNLAQTHMQMLVTGAQYCLLTHYHPELPSLVVRIERDPMFDAALITQIIACIKHRDAVLMTLQEMAA